jgi:hypothetical protein
MLLYSTLMVPHNGLNCIIYLVSFLILNMLTFIQTFRPQPVWQLLSLILTLNLSLNLLIFIAPEVTKLNWTTLQNYISALCHPISVIATSRDSQSYYVTKLTLPILVLLQSNVCFCASFENYSKLQQMVWD